MKSLIAKRVISIFVNLRYLKFKLLKYKENKKICNAFDHNFKNIPLYIMSNVSLERYYFVLYDGALILKMLYHCIHIIHVIPIYSCKYVYMYSCKYVVNKLNTNIHKYLWPSCLQISYAVYCTAALCFANALTLFHIVKSSTFDFF